MKIIMTFATSLWLCCIPLYANTMSPNSGQLLSDWIRVHLQLVRTTKGVGHVAYSRHFAYTAVAIYEAALPDAKQYRSLAGQLQGLGTLPGYTGQLPFVQAAGINAAYAEMLRAWYGNNVNAHVIDSMERNAQMTFLHEGYAQDVLQASGDYGKEIAMAVLAWASSDGATKKYEAYVMPTGEGIWTPTPPAYSPPAVPYWKLNRTMIPMRTVQVRYAGPPAYSDQTASEFYLMAKDVYDVSQNLTAEQKAIAWFWDDSPNGRFVSVMGHWSSILAQVIVTENIPLMKSVEAFACMHLAIYDACIEAWRGKYTYHLERPVSFIQEHIDKNWNSLIETPSHPEFPAAHATLSSSAATALTAVLGRISFVDHTYADLGMNPRTFSSFEEAAKEGGFSRLYGGIHYRHSIEEGLVIGSGVAQNTLQHIHLKR